MNVISLCPEAITARTAEIENLAEYTVWSNSPMEPMPGVIGTTETFCTHPRNEIKVRVWTDLSYAVPAQKIAETLRAALLSPQLRIETRAVFEAVLDEGRR